MMKLITIIPILMFVACMHSPPDNQNLIKGDEAKNRLIYEAKAIDNFYLSNNARDSLPYKSAHAVPPAFIEWLMPVVVKINPKLNYDKQSVNDCIKQIRTIGYPLGGVQATQFCDIREAGVIELGPLRTPGRSVQKDETLLKLLSLP